MPLPSVILLLMSLAPLLTAAQHVAGTVTSTAGIPLPYAHVQVLNTAIGTSCDSVGNFRVAVPDGRHTLRVSAVGFASALVDVLSMEQRVSVVLHPSVHELDQFVVSATKREEPAWRSLASVTVLNARELEAMRVWSVGDIVGRVPNMQYAELGVSYQQQVAIRGISVFSETPAFATYVDGVPAFDVAGTALQLLDVERIEVLRGPQGTLYGRNAMGGVINISSKPPGATRRAFAEANAGDQGLQRYSAGAALPLKKDKLFLALAAQYQRINGFYTNDLHGRRGFLGEALDSLPVSGVRMGDEGSAQLDARIHWIAGERTTLRFNTKVQEDRSIGASAYYQAVESDTLALRLPYIFAVDRLGTHRRTVAQAALAVEHRMRGYRIHSTSTWQYVGQAYAGIDQDVSPNALATGSTFRRDAGEAMPQHTLGQELRFTANPGKRIHWTGGLYLYGQWFDKRYVADYERLALFFGMQPGRQVTINDQINTGAALFAQGEWQLSARWRLIGGLRGDHEDRRTQVERYYLATDGAQDHDIPRTLLHSRFQAISPKAALQYTVGTTTTVYGSYARGFRAGGNNMFTQGRYPQYLPETSDNWELGAKYRSPNKRTVASACFFLIDWRNMQLDTRAEAGIWIVDNVGRMRSQGVELELSSEPLPGLRVDVAAGLTDARYGTFNYLGEEIEGHHAVMAPRHTLYVAAQQLLPLGKTLGGDLRVEWRHTGEQYFDLANAIHQPAYGTLNLRAGVFTERMAVHAWVRNLTETTHLAFAMPGYFRYSVLNRPRMIGITLRWQFQGSQHT